jgi:hypothetical protein
MVEIFEIASCESSVDLHKFPSSTVPTDCKPCCEADSYTAAEEILHLWRNWNFHEKCSQETDSSLFAQSGEFIPCPYSFSETHFNIIPIFHLGHAVPEGRGFETR